MDVWRVYVKQSAKILWWGLPSLINHGISKMFSVVTPQAVGNKGKNRAISQEGGQDGSLVHGLTEHKSNFWLQLRALISSAAFIGGPIPIICERFGSLHQASWIWSVVMLVTWLAALITIMLSHLTWKHAFAGCVQNTGPLKVWSRDHSGVPKGVPEDGHQNLGSPHTAVTRTTRFRAETFTLHHSSRTSQTHLLGHLYEPWRSCTHIFIIIVLEVRGPPPVHPQLNRQCEIRLHHIYKVGGLEVRGQMSSHTHNFHQGEQKFPELLKFANVGQKVPTKTSHCARDTAPIITRYDHLVYVPSAAEQVVYSELTTARLHSQSCLLCWKRGWWRRWDWTTAETGEPLPSAALVLLFQIQFGK